MSANSLISALHFDLIECSSIHHMHGKLLSCGIVLFFNYHHIEMYNELACIETQFSLDWKDIRMVINSFKWLPTANFET